MKLRHFLVFLMLAIAFRATAQRYVTSPTDEANEIVRGLEQECGNHLSENGRKQAKPPFFASKPRHIVFVIDVSQIRTPIVRKHYVDVVSNTLTRLKKDRSNYGETEPHKVSLYCYDAKTQSPALVREEDLTDDEIGKISTQLNEVSNSSILGHLGHEERGAILAQLGVDHVKGPFVIQLSHAANDQSSSGAMLSSTADPAGDGIEKYDLASGPGQTLPSNGKTLPTYYWTFGPVHTAVGVPTIPPQQIPSPPNLWPLILGGLLVFAVIAGLYVWLAPKKRPLKVKLGTVSRELSPGKSLYLIRQDNGDGTGSPVFRQDGEATTPIGRIYRSGQQLTIQAQAPYELFVQGSKVGEEPLVANREYQFRTSGGTLRPAKFEF